MHRTTALFALLLLPLVALAQPRIKVSPEHLEFGVLQRFETREAKVTISNTGDETLHIREVESTCGCTVPELKIKKLAPGASTIMDVQFNSKTFQGPQTKYIHIITNDPARGSIELLVTADIKVPLTMNPPKAQVQFPTVKVGESKVVTYTFSSEDVSKLEMKAVAWPKELLDIKVNSGKDQQTVLVDFVIKTDAPPGRHREPIKLSSNVPTVPTVNLEADVKLVTDVVVNPERVNLRVVRPSQTLKTQIRFALYTPGDKFEITEAKIDIPGLRTTIENNDRECVVRLSGQSMAADDDLVVESSGRIKGTLTVKTNLKSTPELSIPVSYMIRN